MSAGDVNAWKCDACGRLLVAVDVVEGVTPMTVRCRFGRCSGAMVSSFYPPDPVPSEILEAIAWECRLATRTERKRWKRDRHPMLDHVNKGGLVLDRLTMAGARAVAKRHNFAPTLKGPTP